MKIGSLCTGYGGLDMAVEAYFGAKTIWVAEFDKYASQIIDLRWELPNYGDITKINWGELDPIDILTAGYPCQPFSHAGHRKGENDKRHIWPDIKKAISELRPRIVILENVRGHLTLGFKEVLQELTEIGYDATWTIIRASDVGAPHRRERIFVIAYPQRADPDSFGLSLGYDEGRTQGNKGEPQSLASELGEVITDSLSSRRFESRAQLQTNRFESSEQTTSDADNSRGIRNVSRLSKRFDSPIQMRMRDIPNPLDNDGKLNPQFVEYMMGLPSGWVTDSGLSRPQQLKILGNGVVPQQAYAAIHRLLTLAETRPAYA
jgi:DNA (cytosine-5)-methyltransferase 1